MSDKIVDDEILVNGKFFYNKYEKRILFPLLVMKILFSIGVLINLAFPIYKDGKIGATHVITYVVIGMYLYTLLGGLGRLKQTVALLPLVMLRSYQFLSHMFFWNLKINVIYFVVATIYDILYCTYFMIDRANYKYIYVDEFGNEE